MQLHSVYKTHKMLINTKKLIKINPKQKTIGFKSSWVEEPYFLKSAVTKVTLKMLLHSVQKTNKNVNIY